MIVGIVGEIGSGKSHYQLKHALEQCNKKQKRLVANFKIDTQNSYEYCCRRKLGWVAQHIYHDQHITLSCRNRDDVMKLLSYPASVVCLDEAGIFFNSRNFKDMPKDLLSDLAQSRKTGADLYWAAQFDQQVDRQFRMLTQYYVFCQGFSAWDRNLRQPGLKWKSYHHFKAAQYQEFDSSPKLKNSLVKTWWRAFHNEVGPLSKDDIFLFSCYESFSRLDSTDIGFKPPRESYTEADYQHIYRASQRQATRYRQHQHNMREFIKTSPMSLLFMSPRQIKRLYRS